MLKALGIPVVLSLFTFAAAAELMPSFETLPNVSTASAVHARLTGEPLDWKVGDRADYRLTGPDSTGTLHARAREENARGVWLE